MVNVTGVECTIDPDVPVTIIVTVLGLVDFELELLPPQPTAKSRISESTVTPPTHNIAFRAAIRFLRPPANTIPTMPKPESGSQPIVAGIEYPPTGI
jgi:hypothetical protein